jgi:hypothetical protein
MRFMMYGCALGRLACADPHVGASAPVDAVVVKVGRLMFVVSTTHQAVAMS